jgi:hypothetical protein
MALVKRYWSARAPVSIALPAYHCGAASLPVDADPETGNLARALVESLITERTKAIIPIHLLAHPVMGPLLEFADRHERLRLENGAESPGATDVLVEDGVPARSRQTNARLFAAGLGMRTHFCPMHLRPFMR